MNATSNADLTRNEEQAEEEQGNVEWGAEDEDDEEERGDQALPKVRRKYEAEQY